MWPVGGAGGVCVAQISPGAAGRATFGSLCSWRKGSPGWVFGVLVFYPFCDLKQIKPTCQSKQLFDELLFLTCTSGDNLEKAKWVVHMLTIFVLSSDYFCPI